MSSDGLIAVGVDLGTGGARALALDLDGRVVATGRAELPAGAVRAEGVRCEQEPRTWTDAVNGALRELTSKLPASARVGGVSVDATSGTFVLVDEANRPVTPGIMYNDLRAAEDGPRCAEALRDVLGPYGIEVAAAFALPKIAHLARTEPRAWARCRRIVHQTDWVVGLLSGRYDMTDVSTALKTGVDPGRLVWPGAIETQLGVPLDRLPAVVLPGTTIGAVTREAAESTGLPAGTPVVSGCTDGTAGCLASGASRHGDLNVTLGTTLVFKAVADKPIVDPAGVVYNHRHPAGGYLPGAASNTGAAWTKARFAGADLDRLGEQASALIPTGRLVYPLTQTGERFPFTHPQATAFGWDSAAPPAEMFAAGMEGVAMLERLGIERLDALGLSVNHTVYATGGSVASDTLLRIRSAVNRRVYATPELPECAVGAAILAAAAHLGGCGAAIQRMVRIARRCEPDERLAAAYNEVYGRFCAVLHERGYL
ncbi:MAG: FGGY-family carbohydrate kinase [Planctomycetes bacterium]|nr:FGGY-family carbohydrate kinase [Planctomycetota bacterium]